MVYRGRKSVHGYFLFGLTVAAVLAAGATASGAIITFTNTTIDLTGQGFGSAPPILTLQAHGNATTEYGSVTWNGSADVLTGDAQGAPKTQTLTASELLAAGSNQSILALAFNINEDGSANVLVHDFYADFFGADGSLLFSAKYTAPVGGLDLPQEAPGQGGSAWIFGVHLTNSESTQFFGDLNNRMGMHVLSADAIEGVSDGAESFVVIPSGFVPEPATLTLMGLGLGVTVLLRRKRK